MRCSPWKQSAGVAGRMAACIYVWQAGAGSRGGGEAGKAKADRKEGVR